MMGTFWSDRDLLGFVAIKWGHLASEEMAAINKS